MAGKSRPRRKFVPRIRKNDKIRAREIRVIGPDGSQLGVMPPAKALEVAKKIGLDLIEISASARPPVCRILDFGKYQYEQAKKDKESKAKKSQSKVKEVKFRVRIEQHDYDFKVKHAEEFLGKGFKVKLSLMFRGRENEFKSLGLDQIRKAIKDLEHIGQRDMEPRLNGRFVNAMVSPLPVKDRIFKYNLNQTAEDIAHEEDDHDEDE